MSVKHEVDPTTQGSLLPPTPAGLALGAVVEVDGGFYRTISTEAQSTPSSPEQDAPGAEAQALFFLDRAATSDRNIANMKKYQHNLKVGRVRRGTDVPTEQERIGIAIRDSEEYRANFRRQAKINFGKSMGIKTITEYEEKWIDGRPVQVPMIRAEDADKRDEFEDNWRSFTAQYAGPRGEKNRSSRLQALRPQMQPIESQAA